MWVRRSDWERVTEREELVGRTRVGSRFPQYLITAILTGAVVLARYIFWSAIVQSLCEKGDLRSQLQMGTFTWHCGDSSRNDSSARTAEEPRSGLHLPSFAIRYSKG